MISNQLFTVVDTIVFFWFLTYFVLTPGFLKKNKITQFSVELQYYEKW